MTEAPYDTFGLFDEPPCSEKTLTNKQRYHIRTLLDDRGKSIVDRMAAAECAVFKTKHKAEGRKPQICRRGLLILGYFPINPGLEGDLRSYFLRFVDLREGLIWKHALLAGIVYQRTSPQQYLLIRADREFMYELTFFHEDDAKCLYDTFNARMPPADTDKSLPPIPGPLDKKVKKDQSIFVRIRRWITRSKSLDIDFEEDDIPFPQAVPRADRRLSLE